MTTREIERRHVHMPVEWRAAANGDGLGRIGGYAAVYNKLSQNLGGYVEQIAPGAFDKSLADGVRVICRTHHKDTWLLGTTEAETLRLSSDGTGLLYDDDLPDTAAGRDTQTLAKRGDLRYSSFAFRCIEDEWSITPDGFPLRTILAAQLVDVAPVVEPAYLDSTTGVRSLAGRVGLAVDVLKDMPTEEIRSLLTRDASQDGSETPDNDQDADDGVETDAAKETGAAQRETHAPVTLRARLLELERLR